MNEYLSRIFLHQKTKSFIVVLNSEVSEFSVVC